MNYFAFAKSRKGRPFPRSCFLILSFKSDSGYFQTKFYPNYWDDVFTDIFKYQKGLYKDLKGGRTELVSFMIRRFR